MRTTLNRVADLRQGNDGFLGTCDVVIFSFVRSVMATVSRCLCILMPAGRSCQEASGVSLGQSEFPNSDTAEGNLDLFIELDGHLQGHCLLACINTFLSDVGIRSIDDDL